MDILVHPNSTLSWPGPNGLERRAHCAVGRSGIGPKLREGDGLTPVGRWRLKAVMFRPDRAAPPPTVLPTSTIAATDGWCDDPDDAAYNRRVTLPHPASFEDLWRDDGLYDIVVELGHNDDPVVPGKGSAIFLHLASPDYAPTEGCVALALEDMLELLGACDGDDWLVVG